MFKVVCLFGNSRVFLYNVIQKRKEHLRIILQYKMTAGNVTQRYAFAVGGSQCIAHTYISLATPPRSHSACYTSWITNKKTGLQQNGKLKWGFFNIMGMTVLHCTGYS